MDTKSTKGKWGFISSQLKDEIKNRKRSSSSNCSTQRLKGLYAKGISADKADSFDSKDFEEDQKRNMKIQIGREERRQKYDLAEEKREVFRTQIRQKYGIKSKEDTNTEKGLSKSFEGGFRAFISVDFFKSKEKTEKKKGNTKANRETRK